MGKVVNLHNFNEELAALCINCFTGVPLELIANRQLGEANCPKCNSTAIVPSYQAAVAACETLGRAYEAQQEWVAEAAKMLEADQAKDRTIYDFIKQTGGLSRQLMNDPIIMERVGPEFMARYAAQTAELLKLVTKDTGGQVIQLPGRN